MRPTTTLRDDLDDARAHILALQQQLADERAAHARTRQDLERMRKARGSAQKRQLARGAGQFDIEAFADRRST